MFTRLALSGLILAWASVVLAAPEPPPPRDEIRLPVIDMPTPTPTSPTAVISDGKGTANSYEGPLPATVAEFQRLIEKASK